MPIAYFDIDGTLIDSNKVLPDGSPNTAIMPAWNRLGYGVSKVCGHRMPPNFDWEAHKGSTDLAVVRQIVSALQGDDIGDNEYKVREVLKGMDDYYCENARQGLEHLVFPGTRDGLRKLVELGVPTGIVTGNTKRVTHHKLENAGLLEFFPNEKLWFTGDMAPARATLLQKAFLKNPECNEEYVPDGSHISGYNPNYKPEQSKHATLVYFGDALGDVNAANDFYADFLKQYQESDIRLFMRISPGLRIPRIPSLDIQSVMRFNLGVFRNLDHPQLRRMVTAPYEDMYAIKRDLTRSFYEPWNHFGLLPHELLSQSEVLYWTRSRERR